MSAFLIERLPGKTEYGDQLLSAFLFLFKVGWFDWGDFYYKTALLTQDELIVTLFV